MPWNTLDVYTGKLVWHHISMTQSQCSKTVTKSIVKLRRQSHWWRADVTSSFHIYLWCGSHLQRVHISTTTVNTVWDICEHIELCFERALLIWHNDEKICSSCACSLCSFLRSVPDNSSVHETRSANWWRVEWLASMGPVQNAERVRRRQSAKKACVWQP